MTEEIDRKFLLFLRRASIVEGISTLILFFVAMPLKYMAGIPEAVTVVGSVHGILFLGIVLLFFIALDKVPLPLHLMVFGIVGAVVPFGPFVVDRWLVRLEEKPSTGENNAEAAEKGP